MVLSNPETNGDQVLIRSPSPDLSPSPKLVKKRSRDLDSDADPKLAKKPKTLANEELPFNLIHIQKLLRQHGDHLTQLTRVKTICSKHWSIQGCKAKGPRQCLLMQGRTHQSNNCLLRVVQMANQLKIFYQCMGTECQKLESMLLGVIETRESIEPVEQNKQFLPTKPVVLIDTKQTQPADQAV